MTSGEVTWPGRLAGRVASTVRNGPLAVSGFRLLSIGQFTSTAGDYCYAVALPWLVLSARGGPLLLGTVLACYGVPRTALIPLGGILADKLSSRTVMLVADALRCVLVAGLTVLAARHIDALAALAPIAALLGAGEGVFLPASFSIMPTLLPAAQLAAGNAISTALVQVGSLAGPVLAGVLVAAAGSAPAFAADAASFAVSAIALSLIGARRPAPAQPGAVQAPAAEPASEQAASEQAASEQAASEQAASEQAASEQAASEQAASEQAEGPGLWEILRSSPFLQILLVVSIMANFASGGTFEVAMPALAHALYGASGYGALVACFAFGALGGTLGAARMSSFPKPVIAALTGFIIESVAISLIPFLGGLPGAATALTIAGLCNGFGNIVMVTLLQQWAPAQSIGRIMSLLLLASFGTFPISVVLAGVLVRHLHAAPFFPIAGIMLGVVILFAFSRRDMRNFGARQAQAG